MVNVCIVIIGTFYNIVRRRPLNSAIISQKHILKLESTKVGTWVTSVVAILMPFFIFLAAGALSGYGLYELYADQSKISIIDATKYTVGSGVKGINIVHTKLSVISKQSQNILDTDGAQTLTVKGNQLTRLAQNVASFVNMGSISAKQGLFTSLKAENPALSAQFMGMNRLPNAFIVEKATTSLIHQELYTNLSKKSQGEVLGVFWLDEKENGK